MDPLFSGVVHVCVCIMYARMDGWIDEWMFAYNYECIHTFVCAHTYNYESMHTHVYTCMHEFAWNCIVV